MRRSIERTLRALSLLLLALVGTAWAGTWEFRICAEPDNLPFSNDAAEGFENEIAEVIADELGAELSYVWLPRPTSRYREIYLRSGRCDAVMGIADAVEGFLTSHSYYRSSYVFVYRRDSPFEIDSLDDPVLSELRIAVGGGGRTGPERLALAERGLLENQRIFAPDFESSTPHSAPIEAVSEGRADVALLWGPVAGFAARRSDVPLEIRSIANSTGAAFLPMVIPISVGLRPYDTALRDLISVALARRWQEIEAILESYGVPVAPLPRPDLGEAAPGSSADEDPLELGLVVPTPTGEIPIDASAPHSAALAALQGAVLAEEDLNRSSPSSAVHILGAAAPDHESARRAAERLVLAEGVAALIGGLADGQSEVLAEVAQEHGVLFFDIGTPSLGSGRAGSETSFHLQASASMYLEAIARSGTDAGAHDWYLLHDKPRADLAAAAVAVLGESGAEVVGLRESTGSDYSEILNEIRELGPDSVFLLLDWRSQLEFLGLFDAFGLEPQLTGMPYPMTQTRTFYLALQRTSVEANALRRVALWEPGLEVPGAADLAERYFGRWGLPMEASAWLGYQAIAILQRTADATGSGDARDFIDYLERDDTTFEVAKGEPVRFDPESHQLVQPLYLVRVEPRYGRLAEVELVIEPSAH